MFMVMMSDCGDLARTAAKSRPGPLTGDASSEAHQAGNSLEAKADELSKRLRQLLHAEERLRPLRDTPLASTYWQVHRALCSVQQKLLTRA